MHTATVVFNRRSLEVMTLALVLSSFAHVRLIIRFSGSRNRLENYAPATNSKPF